MDALVDQVAEAAAAAAPPAVEASPAIAVEAASAAASPAVEESPAIALEAASAAAAAVETPSATAVVHRGKKLDFSNLERDEAMKGIRENSPAALSELSGVSEEKAESGPANGGKTETDLLQYFDPETLRPLYTSVPIGTRVEYNEAGNWWEGTVTEVEVDTEGNHTGNIRVNWKHYGSKSRYSKNWYELEFFRPYQEKVEVATSPKKKAKGRRGRNADSEARMLRLQKASVLSVVLAGKKLWCVEQNDFSCRRMKLKRRDETVVVGYDSVSDVLYEQILNPLTVVGLLKGTVLYDRENLRRENVSVFGRIEGQELSKLKLLLMKTTKPIKTGASLPKNFEDGLTDSETPAVQNKNVSETANGNGPTGEKGGASFMSESDENNEKMDADNDQTLEESSNDSEKKENKKQTKNAETSEMSETSLPDNAATSADETNDMSDEESESGKEEDTEYEGETSEPLGKRKKPKATKSGKSKEGESGKKVKQGGGKSKEIPGNDNRKTGGKSQKQEKLGSGHKKRAKKVDKLEEEVEEQFTPSRVGWESMLDTMEGIQFSLTTKINSEATYETLIAKKVDNMNTVLGALRVSIDTLTKSMKPSGGAASSDASSVTELVKEAKDHLTEIVSCLKFFKEEKSSHNISPEDVKKKSEALFAAFDTVSSQLSAVESNAKTALELRNKAALDAVELIKQKSSTVLENVAAQIKQLTETTKTLTDESATFPATFSRVGDIISAALNKVGAEHEKRSEEFRKYCEREFQRSVTDMKNEFVVQLKQLDEREKHLNEREKLLDEREREKPEKILAEMKTNYGDRMSQLDEKAEKLDKSVEETEIIMQSVQSSGQQLKVQLDSFKQAISECMAPVRGDGNPAQTVGPSPSKHGPYEINLPIDESGNLLLESPTSGNKFTVRNVGGVSASQEALHIVAESPNLQRQGSFTTELVNNILKDLKSAPSTQNLTTPTVPASFVYDESIRSVRRTAEVNRIMQENKQQSFHQRLSATVADVNAKLKRNDSNESFNCDEPRLVVDESPELDETKDDEDYVPPSERKASKQKKPKKEKRGSSYTKKGRKPKRKSQESSDEQDDEDEPEEEYFEEPEPKRKKPRRSPSRASSRASDKDTKEEPLSKLKLQEDAFLLKLSNFPRVQIVRDLEPECPPKVSFAMIPQPTYFGIRGKPYFREGDKPKFAPLVVPTNKKTKAYAPIKMQDEYMANEGSFYIPCTDQAVELTDTILFFSQERVDKVLVDEARRTFSSDRQNYPVQNKGHMSTEDAAKIEALVMSKIESCGLDLLTVDVLSPRHNGRKSVSSLINTNHLIFTEALRIVLLQRGESYPEFEDCKDYMRVVHQKVGKFLSNKRNDFPRYEELKGVMSRSFDNERDRVSLFETGQKLPRKQDSSSSKSSYTSAENSAKKESNVAASMNESGLGEEGAGGSGGKLGESEKRSSSGAAVEKSEGAFVQGAKDLDEEKEKLKVVQEKMRKLKEIPNWTTDIMKEMTALLGEEHDVALNIAQMKKSLRSLLK